MGHVVEDLDSMKTLIMCTNCWGFLEQLIHVLNYEGTCGGCCIVKPLTPENKRALHQLAKRTTKLLMHEIV